MEWDEKEGSRVVPALYLRESTAMYLLQVSSQESGGAARIAKDLYRTLRHRGEDCYLAVGRKGSDDPYVVEIPNTAYRDVRGRVLGTAQNLLLKHRIGSSRIAYGLAILGDPQRRRAYLQGMEDFNFPGTYHLLDLMPERPAIVHAHNLHTGYFDLRALPELSQKVPFVLTLHDTWLLSGHCAYSLGCDRWRSGCGSCPDLAIYPRVRRDNTAYNWQRKRDIYARSRLFVVTPSQWLMEEVENSILQAAIVEKRVIPNGVDQSVFCPGDKSAARYDLGLRQDAWMALFVAVNARNNPFKDYRTLEKAIEQAASQPNEQELLFVALGAEGVDRRIGNASIHHVSMQADPAKVAQYYLSLIHI